MSFSAKKFTAVSLLALQAMVGGFEHLWHEVSHGPAEHADDVAQSCCSDCHVERTVAPDEEAPANEHDPEDCVVCRHVALPQFFETPHEAVLVAPLTAEVSIAAAPSLARPIVTLVPIRGPPLNEIDHRC